MAEGYDITTRRWTWRCVWCHYVASARSAAERNAQAEAHIAYLHVPEQKQ